LYFVDFLGRNILGHFLNASWPRQRGPQLLRDGDAYREFGGDFSIGSIRNERVGDRRSVWSGSGSKWFLRQQQAIQDRLRFAAAGILASAPSGVYSATINRKKWTRPHRQTQYSQ
jgi:hypothetical protein